MENLHITSKLPNTGTTIFTVMSSLANEYRAINLGQGFPNFDCPEDLKDLIVHYLRKGKNQYAPMTGNPDLNKALANKIKGTYGYSLNPSTEVTVVAGATQGLFTAIAAFIHPGEEVILIEPAYDSYRPAITLAGGTPVAYELQAPDYRVDWEQVARMISPKTKMIIVNTPQNPIGKALRLEDMEALEQLVLKHDMLVLSDEVYEHLIFDGLQHESVLRFPKLFQRSIAVYSFGKTFHATGWKIGYAVGPEYLMKEFRKVHQYNVFSVNSFIQCALADYLRDPQPYLSLPSFFQKKRDVFQMAMKGSRLKPLISEGTYFQLFDYSEISDESDLDFAKQMTKEYGVAAIPISVFYSSGRQDQIVRLCFAKTDDLLLEAGKRLQDI